MESNEALWSTIIKDIAATTDVAATTAVAATPETTTTTPTPVTPTPSIEQRFRNSDMHYDTLDGASVGNHVITVRRNHRPASSSEPQKPLRLLVMSDTHGMEEQLFKFLPPGKATTAPYQLPAADVLIHCGDFWGSRARTMQLDTFFAAQPHIPIKIVVRGNHDPRTPGSVLFPKSASRLCDEEFDVVSWRAELWWG